MTAHEKVARDAAIICDRARGLTWATIADRHGLTERQCRTIWSERRSGGTELLEVPAVEALREAFDQLEAMIEESALLAETTSNDAVKVAALKLRHALLGDKVGLLQACGLLPQSLRELKRDEEWQMAVDVALDMLERHGGQDALNGLAEELEREAERRGLRLDDAA